MDFYYAEFNIGKNCNSAVFRHFMEAKHEKTNKTNFVYYCFSINNFLIQFRCFGG